MNPNNLSVVSAFCAIFSIISIAFGWLVKQGQLPFKQNINSSDRQVRFLQVWVKLALVLGVIIPGILLAASWNNIELRRLLVAYLLAVAVQLLSEKIFSQWLCPSVVVEIGLVYTSYRIWQLMFGFLSLDNSIFSILLGLVLLFWIANLIMLLLMSVPTILWRSPST